MSKIFICAAAACLALACPAKAAETAYAREQQTFLTLLSRVEEDPDNPALREELIRFANNMKTKPKIPVEAKKQFIRAMAVQLDAVNNEDFDKAARLYGEAIKIAPWWTQCYYNRAAVLESASRPEEAAEDKRFYLAARAAPKSKPAPALQRSVIPRSGTADYRGNWGSGLDCWRYEFDIQGEDLTIIMHCWDFPKAIYGTGKVSGRRFEGSSPGGISGTGVGTRSPIRFRGTLSEDNSSVEISSMLAPELAETEGAMSAAKEQVSLFGEPSWQTQTWRHMARD
ncbi:MAG: hypothetical protein A2X35_04365 [Elusimicrobia bacterium GWA2_61_42]|nr:MAG: hypothetical protein A2X35_04365 [Elusimicrobia bacterium GWA2_61_42]OGR76579.1 MAG: hypothetical protein A2X38_03280 [Elusimicrobia bacterium GWC2_61_25]